MQSEPTKRGGAVLAKNLGLVRKEKETIFCIITRIWFWCILMSDFVELVAEWVSGGVLASVMLCKIKVSASFCRGVIFNNLAGHLYKLSNSYEKVPSGFAFVVIHVFRFSYVHWCSLICVWRASLFMFLVSIFIRDAKLLAGLSGDIDRARTPLENTTMFAEVWWREVPLPQLYHFYAPHSEGASSWICGPTNTKTCITISLYKIQFTAPQNPILSSSSKWKCL